MKKMWSLLLAVAMLYGMCVVPVGAEDLTDEVCSLYPEYARELYDSFYWSYYKCYNGNDLTYTYDFVDLSAGMMIHSLWEFSLENVESHEDCERCKEGKYYSVYEKTLLEELVLNKFNLDLDYMVSVIEEGERFDIFEYDGYIYLSTYGVGDGPYELYVNDYNRLNNGDIYVSYYYAYDNGYDNSGNIYAVLKNEIVAGREIVGYRYLGTTPPSDELLAQYGYNKSDIAIAPNGNKIKLQTNTTYYYDLDCDGVDDEIYMYEDEIGTHECEVQPHTYRFNVVINGQNYPHITGYGWVRQIYIMDINMNDNAKEIVVIYGYRDASWVGVIRYGNGEAKDIYFVYNDGERKSETDGKWSHNTIEDTLGMEPITYGNGTLYLFGELYGSQSGEYTDKYQEIERGTLVQFTDEPKNLAITVTLNGDEIQFDQPPIIKDDRTLVPLRAIFEAMGCDVEWDGELQQVDVYKNGDNVMTLWIDEYEMWTENGYITLDVPPQIINDRTLVPVRAISESMGAKVEWYGDQRLVNICYYPPYSGTTTNEYYYRNQSDVVNFGSILNDNPYWAGEDEYCCYYYSYDENSDIDYCVEEYLDAMESEGFDVDFIESEGGSDFYKITGYGYEIWLINDYLLEHIQIEIK